MHDDTKGQLDMFREYRNESYDEVIRKVIYIAKNAKGELATEAKQAIEKARSRMKEGRFLTEEQAKKRLGL